MLCGFEVLSNRDTVTRNGPKIKENLLDLLIRRLEVFDEVRWGYVEK